MDADLQHPPEKIPELLEGLESSDISIGSRFIEGDTIEHWGLWRKFVNKTASVCYNLVYWRNKLSDRISGFFCF
jgi:dolichol-phosphate mannosyltransferase